MCFKKTIAIIKKDTKKYKKEMISIKKINDLNLLLLSKKIPSGIKEAVTEFENYGWEVIGYGYRPPFKTYHTVMIANTQTDMIPPKYDTDEYFDYIY